LLLNNGLSDCCQPNLLAHDIVDIIGGLGLYERSLYQPQFGISGLFISTQVLYIIVISSGLCYLILEVSQLRRYPNTPKRPA
jgi:hypothetical protein